ncbi:MAG: DUF4347 domain-containing protein, partial [Cyanobacteria bacterium J06623_5]
MKNAQSAASLSSATIQRSEFSQHLFFIDSRIDDIAMLANGIISGSEVVLLSPEQDGIAQITQALQYRQDLVTIHLISHGKPGHLYIGNTRLNRENLLRYASKLHRWSEYADALLLYGCNVAAGCAGNEFINTLHQLTNVPVAASTSRTGAAALGGNWNLEVTTHPFEVPSGFQAHTREHYQSVFATFNVNSLEDVDDGDIGNDTTTLREAIRAANAMPGDDDIDLSDLDGTITLTDALPSISSNI